MEAKDWAPWVGIVASLGWNFFNTMTSSRQRHRAHTLSEFKTLKTAADLAVAKLRGSKTKIKAFELSGSSTDEINADLQKLNLEISGHFNELVVALEALDTSGHSRRTDWVEKSNLRWDELANEFDRLYAPKTNDARKAVLLTVSSKLDRLTEAVHRELESELAEKAA